MVVNKSNISKQRQKRYYDRSVKTLTPLNAAQYVRVQIGKIWTSVKIIKKHNNYSYIMQTEHGSTFRKNRQLLKQMSLIQNKIMQKTQPLNRIRNKARVRNVINSDKFNRTHEHPV